MASALIELGEIRMLRKDQRAAEPWLREALDIRRRKYAARHPAVIGAEVRLGQALTLAGNAAAAEPILREAQAAARGAPFPLQAWQIAETEAALGVCLRRLGHEAEAERHLRETRPGLRKHPLPALRQPLE